MTPATVTIATAGNTSGSGNLKAGSYTGIQSVSALGGADAGNYDFTTTPVVGNYVVDPLALTAAIGGVTTTYGTAAAPGAVTLTNKISGDDVSAGAAAIVSPTTSGDRKSVA